MPPRNGVPAPLRTLRAILLDPVLSAFAVGFFVGSSTRLGFEAFGALLTAVGS